MKITATFDLTKIGLTAKQFTELMSKDPSAYWYKHEEPKEYSRHLRDMTQGWIRIGTAKEWDNNSPLVPGTYAIVYDKDGNIENPITTNRTIIFGETTQSAWKRIYTHVGALKGKSTNTTDAWRKRIPKVNDAWNCDLVNELDRVVIFFRPHSVTDKDFQYDSNHSLEMEKQAHAHYYALFGYGTIGNTRDIPSWNMIKECTAVLESKGYNPKFKKNFLYENIF